MQIKTEWPHRVREIEHTWITLSDGARLAARIWLPAEAEAQPVPAILEYLPYRKNDFTAHRDAVQHPYFAGHGYAAVRVDMRGTGDSDGILYDEYLPQEQDDALEVLAWIAAQPWCSGSVGIWGISWGGFNGLQIAARRPPELKAVISLCSTDDRYADDVHYMGGCLLGSSQLTWASTMFVGNARPPDPRIVGERWRALWLERLERTPPFVEAWMAHQRRDAFWQHGSVCEDFAAITVPVYAVGGWADGYTNAVLRLLAGLPGPRKGLIGPWAHLYPEMGVPGPAIGFLQECLRWWDHWLKGIDTGILQEPMLRVWMQDSQPPAPHHSAWPGRWVAEPSWPAPEIQAQTRALWLAAPGTLEAAPAPGASLAFRGSQLAGADAGAWCPHGSPGDMPPDQRAEDGLALSFTSAPLAEPVEILGFPEVTLAVAADRPNALLAVRLCDVAPDGASTLVTRGLLNLTHRDSHAEPTPLEPGREYTVTVRLNAIAHAMPAGHRWRVALSPTYWPWAWPSPEPVTLTLALGAESRLILPVRRPRPEDEQLTPFGPAEGAPPLRADWLRQPAHRRTLEQDQITQSLRLSDYNDVGRRRLVDNGLEYESTRLDRFTLSEDQPLSARVDCERSAGFRRGAWQVRIQTNSSLSADATAFHLTNVLEAYEGETRVFARTWHCRVPRDLV
jgi:putative CocE/NonD family hydrolase